jgi:quinolinate synthase
LLTAIERPRDEIEELQQRISELKEKLNAVIVAHNYQRPEVQDVADFVGDSLDLARKATQVEADYIIFCGVHFMAETAAILNPNRTVLLAHGAACCPMADMVDAADMLEWKERYPEAAVVCYVNTTAEVKAECDICCTSANAVKVVESVSQEEVLFVPDQNLGHYISTKTRKRMVLYPGYCITHARLSAEQVKRARELHPESLVVVHPECSPEVVELADAVLSTSQMIRFCKESSAQAFLIGTEEGLLYRLHKENPGKEFYLIANSLICPNMKRTRLETVVETMQSKRNAISVPEEIRLRAKQSIERMLAIT